MPNSVTFRYCFDETEMARGWNLAQQRWHKLDWLMRGFGIFNIVLAILPVTVLEPRNPGGLVLLLPAVYLLGLPWYRGMLFRRRLAATSGFGAEVSWSLSEASIQVDGVGGQQQIPWDLVSNVVEDEQGTILRLEDKNFIWLPWNSQVEGNSEDVRVLLASQVTQASK